MRSLGLIKLSVVREAIKSYVYNRVSLRLGNLLQLTTTPISIILIFEADRYLSYLTEIQDFSMFSC